MRRTFWIVLLALGTLVGFGAGFAHLYGCRHFGHGPYGYYGHHFGDGPERLEDRAADACVRAAERVLAERRATPPMTPPPPPTPPAAASSAL